VRRDKTVSCVHAADADKTRQSVLSVSAVWTS